MTKYFTIQNTNDTSITSGDLIGQLGFAASNDTDGGDAIVISAAVIASADGTFDATNNPGSLVFATSPTGPATGQVKIVDSGHFEPIGNKIKNLGSSSSQWKDLYVDQIYFDGLGPQTLPFNDFNVSATGDTVTVTDGNTVTFTGQDSVTVSRNGQTIIISGSAGGGGVSTGPAQTIAFFSGDGTLTGDASLTYNEALTSVKLITQGDTLTTGYYIQNAQTQTGNMFQVDTYIETIDSQTLTRDVTSETSDACMASTIIGDFDNTSDFLTFIYGTSNYSSGMLPFNIPDFDADLAADDIGDGATVTFFNRDTFNSDFISGVVAIYTGSADPTIPTNASTFQSLGALTGMNIPLNLVAYGSSNTGNPSVSANFTPALQQYFGLYPNNTGNIIVYWKAVDASSFNQNSQFSADYADTGAHPRLNLTYTYYSGTDTFVDKTNYVVDYQGKLRLNTNDYTNVGNANMIYVSGQDNLPCNMVLNSSNNQTKIVHWRAGEKLYSVGSNTPGTDWSIFDYKNASKPIKIDNTEPSYGSYRDEQVIMRWKGGKVGIYDTTPDYDLDIHGDLGVRSGIYLYNAETVGYDDTSHRIYRSGDILMWNGSPVTGAGGAGGGGGMTSWDLGVGSETTSTITDGDTVTFSGLNQITTTRSTNRIDIDIDLSDYYTSSQVDTISGNLQTQIDANDNYQYWTVTDGVTSENIATTDTVKFTGGTNIGVSYNSSNNTVTISAVGGGGMTSWNIADGSGNTEAIGNADTLYISGAGSVVTEYDTATNIMTISGAAGGGGGTPGGSVNQIQINDGAGGFTAATNSDRFVYDDSTNTFDLGRQSADNVAGGQFTNYWFANNFCVGGGNFSATMDSDANNNTAVGIDALGALTFGDDNVAIGYQAGDALTFTNENVIIGSQAGSAFGTNLNDDGNVIIGYQAGVSATTLNGNIMIGSQAGATASNTTQSIMIGTTAGYEGNGDYNVLIGYQCGYKADGNYNIYIGKPQSSAGGAPNVTGSGNLILGWNFNSINNAIHGLPNGYSSTASEQFAIANSLVGDFSAQRIGVGEAAINALDATLHVIPQNSSDLVLKVQGAASQSENLTNWENSSNVTLAHVDATGGISGTSYTFADGTVQTTAAGGGGGTPGGNNTEFQYNNGGSFAGTTGVVYGATNGTGTIFEVHGTGSPKDTLFAVEYTGVDTPTTVSIYNNDGQTANTFQVLTEGSGDLFTVSPTGKIYYNSSYSKIANSGNIGASMTFDLDTSNIFTGTLTTTSITLSTTNEDIGQRFMLRLKQDGTGSRTVGTWFGNRVKWPGGSAPTLSTSANLVDLFGFLVTSGSAGTFYYDGFTIATGLQ
jgi:hypothetical protein